MTVVLTLIKNQDKGAEGRGRLARLQRRLLLAEIERKIMEIQSFENDNLVSIKHMQKRRKN